MDAPINGHKKLTLANALQILGVIGTIASFMWGILTWKKGQDDQRQSAAQEAAKPFLERQLVLYENVTETAARVATLPDGQDRDKSKQGFWEMYWGTLAMVENKDVEAAMVNYGDVLKADPKSRGELQRLALDLADRCRISLAKSWGTEAWVNPDKTTRAHGSSRKDDD